MKSITFSPRSPKERSEDPIARTLHLIARVLFITVLAFIPIFIIPNSSAPIPHSKVLLVASGTLLALIFYALAVLRVGRIRLQLTPPVAAIWAVVIAAGISALLTGSHYTSFISHDIPTFSVLFLALFALIVTVCHFLLTEKKDVMYLYLFLFGAGLLLSIFHIARVLLGPEFLSFGVATSSTFTLLGSWNDLGIFYGLLLLLSLIALEQLPLPRVGKYVFAGVSVLSLLLLIIVQFTAVWILVGLGSLVILMYSLMRHRLEADYREVSVISIVLAAITAIISLVFVIGGNQLNSQVSEITNINYLEVRPSLSATLDIGREVMSDNILLGTGPNQFSSAWRMYKDRSINETIFWNTDFIAGNSYVTTFFVSTGLLGIVALLSFLGLLLRQLYRTVLDPEQLDSFWYFVANSATVATLYLWIILFIYVPGTTILLLTAVFTGIALTASTVLRQAPVLWFDTIENRRNTVVLIIAVLLIILTSVTLLYRAQEHFSAHLTYNQALQALGLGDISQSNELLATATTRAGSDLYARSLAQNALGSVNSLLAIADPTNAQRDTFVQDLQLGIEASREAIARDAKRASNWAILAALYGAYVSPETPDAARLAREALAEAKLRDPRNPELYVLEAQIAIRENNLEAGRDALQRSLQLKTNYITAFNVLTELDITEGNIDEARRSVQSILRLQPDNPGRHYQLAILYLADEMTDSAIASFQEAIRLDRNFANARYLLALQYIDRNQYQAAIEQLDVVAQLNPDSEEIALLLQQLRAGEPINIPEQSPVDATDEVVTPQSDGTIQSIEAPDTDLLRSVNPTPVGNNAAQPAESILEAPTPDAATDDSIDLEEDDTIE